MVQPSLHPAFLAVSNLVKYSENGKANNISSNHSHHPPRHNFIENKPTPIRIFS